MINRMSVAGGGPRAGARRPSRSSVAGALLAVAGLVATSLGVPGAVSAAQVRIFVDFSDVPNDHTGDAPEETAIAGGAHATFFITVLNEGDAATNLHITNQVDSRLIVTGVSASPNVGSDVDASAQGIDWVVPSLGDESIIELTVTFRVAATANAGLVVNTASVDADQTDPLQDADDLLVIEDVGLSITKAFLQATVVAGSSGNTFEVSVANSGPSSADNVVVTDAMPSQLHVIHLVGTAGVVLLVGRTITWTLEHLDAGDTAVLTVTYRVDPSVPGGTQVTNAASVESDEWSSGTSTAVVTVIADPAASTSPTAAAHPTASTPSTAPTSGATTGPAATASAGYTAGPGAPVAPSAAPSEALESSAAPSAPAATATATATDLTSPMAVSAAPIFTGTPGAGQAGPNPWLVVLLIGLAGSLALGAIVVARRGRPAS